VNTATEKLTTLTRVMLKNQLVQVKRVGVNKLTKTLSDMTVTEAASLALELIIYGDYIKACGPQRYGTPFEGTFEQYLQEYVNDTFDGDEYYDSVREDYFSTEEMKNYDETAIWQNLHSEGKSGTRDGWTGEVVSSYGGEGQGDQYWMVVSVSDGETTRYFRKDGWYASYDGGYLDGDTYEVKPVERLVKFYE
jgi:hypothetical protein